MDARISASTGESADAVLGRLVDELTARVQRGEALDWDELAHQHPEHAAELRNLVPALAALGELSSSVGSGAAASDDGEPVSGTLGDFRIIREVGRGGMGVVYEAEQLSLRRRVALKVLPFAATMDPRQLQRFRNEALAAASLQHPNIVAVYGVGCERAVHFIAMQFVEGTTLASLISDVHRPQAPPTPADPTGDYVPGNDGATTLAAAGLSTQGGRRGAEFYRNSARLIIQAAEALEHAHSMGVVHRDVKPGNLMVDAAGKLWVADFGLARTGADAGLTMSGDLLGTLRYMSPEQALARHGLVDHRTDVYALGAVLYELLTGRPVVAGDDKQEMLRQIAFEEPAAPRKQAPSIPLDLETVVLKAIAKNPHDRYAGAQDLADDLRRWLEHKPLRARREGHLAKARRWCRRNPAPTALIVVILLASTGLSGTTILFWKQKKHAENSRQQADDALRKELRHRKRARHVVDTMYTGVAESLLLFEPGRGDKRSEFLRKALEFYEEEAQEWGDDVEVRAAAALANARVARSYWALGQNERSLAAYDRAVELCEGIVENGERPVEVERTLAELYFQRSFVLHNLRGRAAAESERRRSLQAYSRLAAALPGVKEYRTGEAHVASRMGLVMSDPRAAERQIRDGLDLAERVTREFPATGEADVGCACFDLGCLFALEGRLKEAKQLLDRGLNIFQSRAAKYKHPDDWLAAGETYTVLGRIHAQSPQGAEAADECFRQATAIFRRVDQDFGGATSRGVNVLAGSLVGSGRLDQAIERCREAIGAGADTYATHCILGAALMKQGRRADAEVEFRKSIQLDRNYCFGHRNLGLALEERGQLAQAAEEFRRAISTEPDRAELHIRLGVCLFKAGLAAEAVRSFEAALRANDQDLDAHLNLLLARVALGDRGKAVRLAARLVSLGTSNGVYRNPLGVASHRTDDYQVPIWFLERSVVFNRSGSASDYLTLSMAHVYLGERTEASAWYERAVDWIEQNAPKDKELAGFRAETAAILNLGSKPPGEGGPLATKP